MPIFTIRLRERRSSFTALVLEAGIVQGKVEIVMDQNAVSRARTDGVEEPRAYRVFGGAAYPASIMNDLGGGVTVSGIRTIFGACLMFLAVLATAGEVYIAGPANYRPYLARLGPGDTLRLEPGIYRRGLPLRGVRGEPGAPVIIEGPASGEPATFVARSGRITVSLIDVAYVEIRNLRLEGRGLPAHGVVAEGRARFAHDVTLSGLEITGFDAAQGYNGISTKSPAWNWVIRGNRIHRVGTGLYLGDSDGSAPFVAGLIEDNEISDTIGYNLQIKHQNPRPDLPGMPPDGSVTIIRGNFFSKARGGSEGAAARPNVLVGHWPLEGAGSHDRYLIHDNLFFENPSERLFQGEGNVALYRNRFVNTAGEAVSFQRHNDAPRAVAVLFNTIVSRGTGLRLVDGAPGHERLVAGNAVFSEGGIKADPAIMRGNLEGGYEEAGETLEAPFERRIDRLDLRPRGDRLRATGDWGALPDLPGLEPPGHYGAPVCRVRGEPGCAP